MTNSGLPPMHQNVRRLGPTPTDAPVWETSSEALGALFSQPSRFAFSIAQVIEPRATRMRPSQHLYPVDTGRMKQERSLDADTVGGDAPNRERGARSTPADAENGALEGLHAFAFTFDDADVHLDGVARLQLGDVWISL